MEQENLIGAYASKQGQIRTKDVAKKSAKRISQIIYPHAKRIFDFICGLIGSILMLPILLVVKIAYIFTGDFAPIVLKQKRLTTNGETFTLYKIRSMITGKNGELEAQNLLEDLFKEHPELEEEYKRTRKLENDPRITKIGKYIRRTSLDEFPQFFNVLKGDISVIGNRPYLPSERKDMGLFEKDILSTKPGIISYWAINGRNSVDFYERLTLEQYYSIHQGPRIDAKIASNAFRIVISGKGAK